VRPVSGIRFGKSLGSPITFIIENRDFKNWVKKMSADPGDRGARRLSRERGPVMRTWRCVLNTSRRYSRRAGAGVGARNLTRALRLAAWRSRFFHRSESSARYVASIGATDSEDSSPRVSIRGNCGASL